MKKIIYILCFLLSCKSTHCQNGAGNPILKTAMSKLKCIVGEWSGTTQMTSSGQEIEFSQTETVKYILDSTIILMEGIGRLNGQIFHNAIAIISYNSEKKHYLLHTYSITGKGGSYKGELIGDVFTWHGDNNNTRYSLQCNINSWMQIGERLDNNLWDKFLEMKLNRIR